MNYTGETGHLQSDVRLGGFINFNIICNLVCVSISFSPWRFLLTVFEAIETSSDKLFRDNELYRHKVKFCFGEST